MRKLSLSKILIAFLLGTLAFTWSCQQSPKEAFVSNEEFLHPGNDCKVHTWWHWVDGAISKEGITKDLEAMKAQGVSQATILDIGGLVKKDQFDVPEVKFGTDKWYEMFSWALQEAKRLGITIGTHNCDGWSSSGGPWITPEQSMKMFTWSTTIVEGNKNIAIKLNRPFAKKDFYQDVAVIAYPSNSLQNSFVLANPEITINDTIKADELKDGSPVSALPMNDGYKIVVKFDNDFKAEKIAFLPRKVFSWSDISTHKSSYVLSVSDNGKTFKKVKEFDVNGLNSTKDIMIDPVTAKYFRLEVKKTGNTESWLPFALAELEILKKDEMPAYQPNIACHEAKVVAVKANTRYDFETINSGVAGLNEDQIIDITDKMKEDGTLNWDAPAGNWNIIRFGYTTTGAQNGPATKEGTGLECDKMDSSAVAFHYSQYPLKLVKLAGDMAGNTFKFFLIDSWECGYQNWTKAMPREFEKRRGYKITKFIPALCGQMVGDAETTDAFLYDFRKTISDLIEDNYYKKFNEMCHHDKMEMHAEVIYGGGGYPPLDVLSCNRFADLPMFEFWAGHGKTTFPEYTAQKNVTLDFPESGALFYDKKVFGAEAYTAMAHYSECPWDLKPFGDRAYCTGINQFILHSYVHQPSDRVAGMTLGPFASHFNRLSPWYNLAVSWFEYQARIQSVLRKGQMQADVLYYVGDQLPQFLEPNKGINIPVGYQIHVANFDILKNKVSVKEGKIVFGNVKFALLTLPEKMGMELSTLQRIEELVKEGAVVYGAKPVKPLSMKGKKNDNAAFNDLVNKLWGKIDSTSVTENAYGKGKVFWGPKMEVVLNQIGVKPDFSTDQNTDTTTFLYTHRAMSDMDVYFVFNQQEKENVRTLFFRTSNAFAKTYNLENGEIKDIAVTKDESGRIKVPFTFSTKQSMIFVFSKEGTPVKAEEAKAEIADISDLKGTISFDTRGYGKIEPVEVTGLKSLTDFDQKDVKYFSGFATYDLTFTAPKGFTDGTLFIDMGQIGCNASVSINGKDLGTIWVPNTQLNVTGLLKEQNTMKVVVGNVYRNRIVGDYKEFGKLKNIWTSATVDQFLNKDKPLKPSGLIGPLKLVKK